MHKLILALLAVAVFFTSCQKQTRGYSARPVATKTAGSPRAQSPAPESDEAFQKLIAELEAQYAADVATGKITEQPFDDANAPTVTPAEPAASFVPEGDTLEISEKMFLTQINDIFFNFEDYKNKTIIVEGMYTDLIAYDTDETYPAVYRLGPGCCGNDGWGGFMLKYDGKLPAYDEWIRVIGKPVLEDAGNGYENLYLVVDSLVVKAERGAEFVYQ